MSVRIDGAGGARASEGGARDESPQWARILAMTSRCPHFLPPYCPDHNRIERCVWRELHANATYNHWCEVIEELVAAAIAYLRRRD
ncbi:MAG: hypothetical protein ACYSUF_02440 [Planctomycetota bacterium]